MTSTRSVWLDLKASPHSCWSDDYDGACRERDVRVIKIVLYQPGCWQDKGRPDLCDWLNCGACGSEKNLEHNNWWQRYSTAGETEAGRVNPTNRKKSYPKESRRRAEQTRSSRESESATVLVEKSEKISTEGTITANHILNKLSIVISGV